MGQCCTTVPIKDQQYQLVLDKPQIEEVQPIELNVQKARDYNDTPSSPNQSEKDYVQSANNNQFSLKQNTIVEYSPIIKWQFLTLMIRLCFNKIQVLIRFILHQSLQNNLNWIICTHMALSSQMLGKNLQQQNNVRLIYEGTWKSGLRHGFGIQMWPDGSVYEGEWYSDQAHGYGRLVGKNGEIYEGQWKEDRANGYGVYDTQDVHYEGQWYDDKQHGQGIERWKNGQVYEGDYLNGQKTGFGKYKWPDLSTYEGQLVDGNPHGKGIYKWEDGRSYDGEWIHNKIYGYGEYKWPDGKVYKGNFIEDKKDGYGELFWPDGREYKGQWKEGKQHGNEWQRIQRSMGKWQNYKMDIIYIINLQ
ncbi:hypothetical protein pb186bvf_013606 [Paramecium bursaria]